jgi:hypothetical protein
VLDEWAARGKHGIRNPAGYLFGIIQRAIRGEFNAWAKKTRHGTAATSGHHPPPSRNASRRQKSPGSTSSGCDLLASK